MARIILEPGEQFTFDSNTAGLINGYADSAEDVRITDDSTVEFDPTFNAGGDTIRFTGVASNFEISLDGSYAVLTSDVDNITVRIPIGEDTRLIFENGESFILQEDANGNAVIGDQVLNQFPTVIDSDGGTGDGTVVLTTGVDNLSGVNFISQPAVTPGGDDLVNTLQDEDVLTGTGEYNTLTATIGGTAGGETEDEIAATYNNIQEVNLSITDDDVSVIDFQDADALEEVNVVRLTDSGAEITLDNLDSTVTRLGVNDATNGGSVYFAYQEDVLSGDDDALTLTLDDTRLSELSISDQDDGEGDDSGYGFEEVTVDVTGNTNIDEMYIAPNDEEGDPNDFDDVRQTIAINVADGASLEVNNLYVEGAEEIALDADGDVVIAQDEDNVFGGEENDGISAVDLELLTITGDGDVTIDGLDGDDEDGLEVRAASMTGDLTLGVEGFTAGDSRLLVESGSGDDAILTYGSLAGSVETNDGDDAVIVNGDLEGTGDISTSDGDDLVQVGDLLGVGDNEDEDDDDLDNDNAVDDAATISTGDGDDVVLAGSLGNAVDYDDGVLDDDNDDDTYVLIGSRIETGDGDDVVVAEELAEAAVIDTGAGSDNVTIIMNADEIVGGDTDDDREVDGDDEEETTGASILLGADDDTITFTDEDEDFFSGEDFEGDNSGQTIVGAGALVDGGSGENTFNVEVVDTTVVVAPTVLESDEEEGDVRVGIDGFQTINLTALDAEAFAGEDAAPSSNDDEEDEVTISLDVLRVSDDLETLNLTSEEEPDLLDARQEIYEEGTPVTFEVDNLREDIEVNLSAQEVTGVGEDGSLEDDEEVDVALDVNMAVEDADGQATTFALNVVAGSGAFDLDLNLDATETPVDFDEDDSDTDDDDLLVENLVINLQDGESHSIYLNGFGDSQHESDEGNVGTVSQFINDDPANNTAEDYDDLTAAEIEDLELGQGNAAATSLTINGTTDGTEINVYDVTADDITINGAADVVLEVSDENNYDIVVGSGDDLIDLVDDLVDDEDSIDGGAGRDTLRVDGNNSLGYSVPPTQLENDDVFENIRNIEVLEIVGGGESTVVLDEEALESGVDTVIIDGNGEDQALNLVLGDDFERDLDIDVTEDTGFVDLSVTNLVDEESSTIDVTLRADEGANFNLNDEFDRATVNLDIVVGNDEYTSTTISGEDNLGAENTVGISVEEGEISSIVLTEEAFDATVDDDNGLINLIVSDDWSESTLVIDASAIRNDDAAGDPTGLTGGANIYGGNETDASLDITGTQNGDFIQGGQNDDIIDGQAGNDEIEGDVVTGQNDVLTTEDLSFREGDSVTFNYGGEDYTFVAGEDGGDEDDALQSIAEQLGEDGYNAIVDEDANTLTIEDDEGENEFDLEASDFEAAPEQNQITAIDFGPGTSAITGQTITVTLTQPDGTSSSYSANIPFYNPFGGAAAAEAAFDTAAANLVAQITSSLDYSATYDPALNIIRVEGEGDTTTFNVTASTSVSSANPIQISTEQPYEAATVEPGPDAFTFDDNVDVVTGGDDVIDGGAGADIIDGMVGDDELTGGSGNDRLTGGEGADTLIGGTGADDFVYNSADESSGLSMDVIQGFTATGSATTRDEIDLTFLTDATFDFVGTFGNATTAETQLSGGDGVIEAVYVTGVSTLYIDTNDNGDIDEDDMAIEITGLTGTLSDANFIFGEPDPVNGLQAPIDLDDLNTMQNAIFQSEAIA